MGPTDVRAPEKIFGHVWSCKFRKDGKEYFLPVRTLINHVIFKVKG
jgi:hypothetical protein